MYKPIIAFILSLVAFIAGASTETVMFDSRVRSLQVRNAGAPYALPGVPVMWLDGCDGIQIDFDVLGEDRDYLRYELVHCNADWQPSTLAPIEYLDGFNEGTIEDYEFSQGTTVHYVHYRLNIPEERMMPLVSGNYLLRVYEESKGPEKPWLQARFAVSEQSAPVRAAMTSRTDIDYNRENQQLLLEVDTEHAGVADMFNDVQVVIEQNGRPDTRRVLSKPLRVSGKTLVYEHLPELIFRAGNEYRRFESVSTQYPGMGVDHVEFISPYYHAVLEDDKSRAGESYHYDQTLSGGYVVREYNSDRSDTESDYLVTHFSLDWPYTPAVDIYIDSDFTGRRLDDSSLMRYNPETQRYERAFMLKQGAYSYQYLAVPKGTSRGRTDIIEGDKYETRNIYNIYVYNRRPGERYDRLVAAYRLGQ